MRLNARPIHTSVAIPSDAASVGTHGLHVFCGLLWLAVMIHQIHRYGFDAMTRRRLACLSLFWHFLDLVWICVFTFV